MERKLRRNDLSKRKSKFLIFCITTCVVFLALINYQFCTSITSKATLLNLWFLHSCISCSYVYALKALEKLATKWLTLYATVFPNQRTVISFHHVFDVYTWHCEIIALNCLPNTVIFVIFAVRTFTTMLCVYLYVCNDLIESNHTFTFDLSNSYYIVTTIYLSLNWWLHVFTIYNVNEHTM